MEATVRMWGTARCCPLVSLEAWSEAMSLAAMVAYTLCFSTVMSKGGGSNRERLQELHQRAVGAGEAAKLQEWGCQRRGYGRGEGRENG
jgi:hypothetical protein